MLNERSKTYGSCAHPRIIKNKYTGDPVYVPCGSCEFCIHNRSVKSELKCNVQLASSKYCEFVTLTYSTEYLPVGKFYQGSRGEVRFRSLSRDFVYSYKTVQGYNRNISFNDEVFDFDTQLSWEAAQLLQKKTHLHYTAFPDGRRVYNRPYMENFIGYLNYRDIQLFLKRLNQNIRSITNEKIYYYVTGEYGPTTFRPHFHLLFFFDSEKLRQSFRQFVSKSWRFGDSDTQHVWSSASCYVAGYVNSIACLPDFFKNSRHIKPFGRFSVHFAQSAFDEVFKPQEDEEIFSLFYDGRVLDLNGKPTLVKPTRSHINRLYPRLNKSKHASVVDDIRVATTVSKLPQVLAKFGFIDEVSSFEFSKRVYYLIRRYLEVDHCLDSAPEELRIIYNACRLSLYINFSDESGCSAIYRLLLQYRNLVDNWITAPAGSVAFTGQLRKAVRSIHSFYDYCSRRSLHDQLVKVEKWSNDSYVRDNLSIYYFYPLTDVDIMKKSFSEIVFGSSVLRASYADYAADNRERIKHKALNDKNSLLIAEVDKKPV
jgi:hypothetical protein